eukprot:6713639-Pyramimonas_sp.AAC.1
MAPPEQNPRACRKWASRIRESAPAAFPGPRLHRYTNARGVPRRPPRPPWGVKMLSFDTIRIFAVR